MNWYDPSDASEPVVTPEEELKGFLDQWGGDERSHVKERFVLLETRGDVERIQRDDFAIEDSHLPMPAFLGPRDLYVARGKRDVSVIQSDLGAPAAVDTLECAIVLGGRVLFAFGLCGAVGKHVNVGDVVIPTSVSREEGTSYHYAPSREDARPEEALVRALSAHLAGRESFCVHTGPTVTTDAVYRQTVNKEKVWRAKGVLAADMEMSALLTVARFRQIPAVALLVVSDKHYLERAAHWSSGGQRFEAIRGTALQRFIEFAQNVELSL